MDRKLRTLKSVLVFLFLVGLLFAALALLPAWAQAQGRGRAAPDEPFVAQPGDVSAQLLVSSTTGYVIDDGSPGFTMTLAPDGWTLIAGTGYLNDYLYTAANTDGDYAQWRPDLAAGVYDVQVHYYAHSNRRDDAEYKIIHASGVTTRRVNQKLRADGSTPPPGGDESGWKSLGPYTFVGDGSGYVQLSDATTAWGVGTYVIADAVRFLPAEVWVDDGYCPACTNDGHLWGVTAFDNIPDGIDAVATNGTVHVGPGEYYQPIAVTRPMTVAGAGSATTAITVPFATNTAVELLANDVTISGFTIEGWSATYGIRNYKTSAPAGWAYDLTGDRIVDNVIRGFDYGVYFRRTSADMNGNEITNNANVGIYLRQSNAPTLVDGNTITCLGGASDMGVYVRDDAAGVTLTANSIMNCADGVRVWQVAAGPIPAPAQTVSLFGNTITGGTRGVYAGRDAGTTWSARTLTIGGSAANTNSIYGNSSYELELSRYPGDIDATYNYWGVCTLREIENEIRHDYDAPALGTVTYEPAICVPYTVVVEATPSSLPADGISTATITATARDVAGNFVLPGTMIGITTSLGSVPYDYAEAEDSAAVTWNPPANWTPFSYGDTRASGQSILFSDTPGDWVSWTFSGEAVSLIYVTSIGGGTADVDVDGVTIKTINFASSPTEFWVEDVITNALGSGQHTITVTHQAAGRIWLDAFRSGAVVAGQGRIVTQLTSATLPPAVVSDTATIWATVYDGRIITSAPPPYPFVTGTASVVFEAADAYISKSASPTSLNSGQQVIYTITYGNSGPASATNARVTDTLPADFDYVSATPAPDVFIAGVNTKLAWDVGALGSGAVGTITVVARPDQSVPLCAPTVYNNVAEIASDVPDAVAANNTSGPVPVTVILPTTVTLSADPTEILVSNGTETTALQVTVRDGNSNLVHGVPVSLTTTDGSFPASGGSTLVVTTTNGVATASLASGPTVTTATITAELLPSCGGMPTATVQVRFLPGLPYQLTTTVFPSLIRLCGGEAVVTATIMDEFGNLVADGTEVTFNVSPGERGDMYPRLTTTLNGVATSIVRAKGYKFGERFLNVYVLAARWVGPIPPPQRVDLEEGLPHSIELTASPDVIPVGGGQSEITALVQDCGGNNVQDGTVVTFTVGPLGTVTPMVTTTTNGRAYTVFQGDCVMGTAVITAKADSVTANTTVTLDAGPADFISVDTPVPHSIQNCVGQAVIVATLYDVCNNLVPDDTPVLFTPQYGYVDADPKLTYTQGGKASTTVTALDKKLETWPTALEQIDVTSGSAFPGFTNLTILPGPVENVTVTAHPDTIPINGDVNFYDIIVEAEVTDCSDTWVEDGTPVTLRTDLGIFRESGMRTLHRMTLDGVVTGTLTSQSIAGWVTISATADSIVDTTMVRFLPGDPWLLDVWGYPTTIPANGMSTSLITALVKDEYHNPVLDGITVTFVTDYGHYLESGDVAYTTTTTVDGYAFATLVSEVIPRTALVRAIAYNDRQGYTYVFFVTPPKIWLWMPIIADKFTH
jgi:uncharacterized repeat protein (TIGR01451 family)